MTKTPFLGIHIDLKEYAYAIGSQVTRSQQWTIVCPVPNTKYLTEPILLALKEKHPEYSFSTAYMQSSMSLNNISFEGGKTYLLAYRKSDIYIDILDIIRECCPGDIDVNAITLDVTHEGDDDAPADQLEYLIRSLSDAEAEELKQYLKARHNDRETTYRKKTLPQSH